MRPIERRILGCFPAAVRPAWRTTRWLLKILIPISLAVCLMQYFGVIEWLANYTKPLFQHLGLRGEAAIPFVTGALTGTYGGLASMMALSLTLREATILTVMICICHALPMESAVVSKTGSSAWKMTILRIVMAVAAAFCLDLVLPEMPGTFGMVASAEVAGQSALWAVLQAWLWQVVKLSFMVAAIIYALMVMQRLLEAFDGIRRISRCLGPLMGVFGLPRESAYLWLVGNVLGISYGSAVMLEMQENHLLTRDQSNQANYHLVMNHSMVEDTIVFASVGISAVAILTTRAAFALIVVWGRKGCLKLKAIIAPSSLKAHSS